MNVVDGDIFPGSVGQFYRYAAANAYGRLVLTDLVAFRQIGIEIVFTGEIIVQINATMAGQPHFYGISHSLFVKEGERTRVPQRYHADVLIWPRAKGGRVGRESLALRR